ncbi:solute carrier family 27 (fatty acid transporter), member 1/4 [Paragonimus westermani]|uniref:Long-chain-fatty-acid--CoA ligase n=1 Tax=Paragonimus westermani TaxID=34504 RepID=A0A5J4N802_9TREM|nr:solute carrier family 27 (fatty acid transporter), member 1/4 [Paragonimus westermani]
MIMYTTLRNSYTKEPFADIFARTVKRRGRDRIAAYFEDQVWTFGQLDDYSNKVANHLLRSGFRRGDKLSLLMHSSPAYVGIWLGAAKIGVATGLLNFNLRNVSLSHCMDAVGGKGIVVGKQLKDAFLEIDGEKRFPADKIWYVDEPASLPESSDAMSTTSEANWNQGLAEVSAAAPPKLARSKTGICGVGQMLVRGTTLAIRAKFSASKFWEDCIKYNCTVVQYIGELCRYLVAQPLKPTDKQHHVRLAFGNGLRKETWIEFQKRFNVPLIGELYGATESNSSIINCDGKLGAIGFIPQLIKGVYPIYLIKMDPVTELPLRDPETGLCIECDADEPGQLIGRIDNFNPTRFYDGYVNKEASDKKILRSVFKPGDAWFASDLKEANRDAVTCSRYELSHPLLDATFRFAFTGTIDFGDL